jgi:hypothetical protein
MWGPLPVGGEDVVRFGLTHATSDRGGVEVDSEVRPSIDALERLLILQMAWGASRRKVSVTKSHEINVDDVIINARLYLPLEATDPLDRGCLAALPGVVLRVKATGFPLSRLHLVRVRDLRPYFRP